jgi:hypothetical protein
LFDRSAWSVPAGFPEPYLYDRLFSGSEIAVGVEAASANHFTNITAQVGGQVNALRLNARQSSTE